VLPIGISFYTFQITSYCIDVYYGKVKRQSNFITFAAYVTLFPQLVAGPIVRYSAIEGTLVNGIDKTKINENFERGITRFAIGLGKKVLIANVIGEFVAEAGALDSRTIVLSWAYAVAVSLQIYFDFSGYSDMAIGLGAMLGFEFPENFIYPYIAKSISEFWRRWHITLGAWFRDYVYIPLGGNRVCVARWIFNILVVWFFTGMWHGADWNFIVWGLYFAVFLILEKLFRKLGVSIVGKVFGHFYVVLAVMISFLIFNADSLTTAWSDITSLFKVTGILDSDSLRECSFILRNRLGILAIGIIGATPLPKVLWRFCASKMRVTLQQAVTVLYVLALIILCTAYLIDGSFNPFLYFRF
jgi:alginate O-acetyltransferase complex protein AlgI